MLRKLLLVVAALVGLALPSTANAACAGGTCFGIATGNWGTTGTWSLTSNGVSCVCTPGAGDAIVFDVAGSNGKTFTMEAAYSISTLISTCTTCTLVQNSFTMTVTGNTLTLTSGMTYSPTNSTASLVLFTSTSGTVALTSGGKNFAAITVNGVGGTLQLQDDLNVTRRTVFDSLVTLTNGTIDANNHNFTLHNFSSSNANTRVLLMGSGTWTISGNDSAQSAWDTTTTTGLTVTPSTSTLAFTYAAGASIHTFKSGVLGAAQPWGAVSASANSTGTQLILATGTTATFSTLAITCPNTVFLNGGTQTITLSTASGLTTSSCTTSAPLLFTTNRPDLGPATISMASGATVFNGAYIRGVTFSGGATFSATNSIDGGGNSGISPISVPSGGGKGYIGGWLFKRDFTPANYNAPAWLDYAA